MSAAALRASRSQRRPPRRGNRLWLAAIAITCAAALSGCEFLGLDMFPAELQNMEATANLAAMAAGEGWTLTRAMKIEELHSPVSGRTHVFAAMETMSGMKLLILDEAGLGKQKTIGDMNLNAAMGVDTAGDFICGRVRVHSSDLTFSIPPQGFVESNRKALSLGSNYAAYSNDRINVVLDVFSPGWATAPSSQIKPPKTSGMGDVAVADFELLVSGQISLLLGGSNGILELRFANEAALNAAFTLPFLDQGAVSTTSLGGSVSDGQAWLTEDGIVAKENDRGSRLVRYAYGSGAELDSKTIESEWMSGLSFEPSGNYWYYYDSRTGRLLKLRTWWK